MVLGTGEPHFENMASDLPQSERSRLHAKAQPYNPLMPKPTGDVCSHFPAFFVNDVCATNTFTQKQKPNKRRRAHTRRCDEAVDKIEHDGHVVV